MVTTERGDRWALVTGASGGIGEVLAKRLAKDRWNLVLVARRAGVLEDLAASLRKEHGIECQVVASDLGTEAGSRALEDAVSARGIAIEALINNAGFGLVGAFAELPMDEQLNMLDLNVRTLTRLTRWVLPSMLARKKGFIMNVASTAAFQPGPFMAVYYASKAYVLSFSEALSEELRGTGVSVTTLCPGFTETGFAARAGERTQTRLFRGQFGVMTAEEVAEAGVRGMLKGKRLVVPGVMNKVLASSTPMGPRALVLKIARHINSPG